MFLCDSFCFLNKISSAFLSKEEQIYYLDCLLRVFLKMDVQIECNLSCLISIFMYCQNMKGLIILKNKRIYIGGVQV
ncbi:hypothetical protein CN263_11460 [Bacillus cereus]|uniref:Uncharacterized protein n=1 Tax=Bacillus cereus TaxID=1396 RepID=A0A9X6VLR9_BACCE|nr:hypothetical protein CN284_27505 [Bacillus cereus]PFD22350.1 hypothetical protein CN263_11460 [Bacillus cereus]